MLTNYIFHTARFRMLLAFLTVLLLGVPETGMAATSKSVIIVGGDHNYPPYEFLDKDGNPTGFNVELTRAIAELMGLNLEIRLGRWDDMRKGLEHGEVDILQGTIQSEVRNKIFDFSPPHSIVHQSVFGRRGTAPVRDISELKGKEVLVQQGGFMHDYLLEKNVGAQLFLVDTHVEAMRQLAAGKRDYALVANLPGLYLSRELGLSNIIPVGKLLAGQPYGYAVKKGNVQLITQFTEGLAILKNTGRYQAIYDKWLGALEPQSVSWSKIIQYGAVATTPFLMILIAVATWNRTLKKEIAQRTEKLQLQQQQLIQADKMASLGILVSGVAHEINNPTGLLLYNLPLLKNIYKVTEEHLEERFQDHGDFMIRGLRYSQLRGEIPRMIDEMHEGANRIKRIVEDLKDFARKDTSELDESISLNSIVRATVRLVDTSIKNATNHFSILYAEELPDFRGNSQRIEQVLVNLILNACQSLPDPEREIRITTLYDSELDEVVLIIQDEGIGIPEENLSHITDPFFTTKRDSGGTGLGLSVSAGIITDHRGRLEFHSIPDQGTTVRVTFPVLKGADPS